MGLMCQPATPAHDAPTPIEAPLRSGPHIPSDSGQFQMPPHYLVSWWRRIAGLPWRLKRIKRIKRHLGDWETWGGGVQGSLTRRLSDLPKKPS